MVTVSGISRPQEADHVGLIREPQCCRTVCVLVSTTPGSCTAPGVATLEDLRVSEGRRGVAVGRLAEDKEQVE